MYSINDSFLIHFVLISNYQVIDIMTKSAVVDEVIHKGPFTCLDMLCVSSSPSLSMSL